MVGVVNHKVLSGVSDDLGDRCLLVLAHPWGTHCETITDPSRSKQDRMVIPKDVIERCDGLGCEGQHITHEDHGKFIDSEVDIFAGVVPVDQTDILQDVCEELASRVNQQTEDSSDGNIEVTIGDIESDIMAIHPTYSSDGNPLSDVIEYLVEDSAFGDDGGKTIREISEAIDEPRSSVSPRLTESEYEEELNKIFVFEGKNPVRIWLRDPEQIRSESPQNNFGDF